MDDKTPNQTPEANQVVDTSLQELHAITFTKQQWIVVFNVLIRAQYSLADSRLVLPIVDQIEPIVAKLSDKDVKPVA